MGLDFGSKKMAKAEIAVYLFVCAFSQAMGCLQLISHSQWGAKPANCSVPMKKLQPEYVIIIHTVGSACHSQDQCCKEMQSMQDFHQRIKGWCDISYNFLIGEDGAVYEGRGWHKKGAHTYSYNDLALGIAFMGTFTERSPNELAWKALKCLLDFSVKEGYLSPKYIVLAHSDVTSTESPGEPIRSVISKWPNYKHN